MIGYAFCGSFCTLKRSFAVFREMAESGEELLPIVSENVWSTDTRFQTAKDFRESLTAVSGREVVHTIVDAEPLGPRIALDMLIISPCTGNTLSKIANGIVDTPVAMAVKSTLRNHRPVLLAVSTNDGLGIGARNLGALMAMRGIYFVPFGQDDPIKKPQSLVAHFDRLVDAARAALNGEQLQPLLI